MTDPRAASGAPSFAAALRAWLYIALNSFGGPAGQIAVMHRELVERRGWLSERHFLHALNYCMLLPGPEAQQLATYSGWLLHGVRGGLAAGLLFIAPGALAMLALSILYALYQDTAVVAALFYGVKPAVVALVALAVVAIGRRTLHRRLHFAIAGAAFVAIYLFDVFFPLILLGAALAGGLWLGRQGRPRRAVDEPAPARPAIRRALAVLAIGLGLWLLPTVALLAAVGPTSVFSQQALFFSGAALVTFGGAYAVLAYIAQQAVAVYGWLSAEQMLDGLGLAESTPGPLIMVIQFVGFMGAFAGAGAMDPLLAGALASALVVWVTFVPSMTWIFAGAPFVEYLRGNQRLNAVLEGVTAAVVGVIANLAAWFALQTFFAGTGELRLGPLRLHTVELATLDLVGLALAGLAAFALVRLRWPLLPTLAACAAAGFGWSLLVG
jgi:chromate transporter